MQVQKELSQEVKAIISIIYKRMEKEYKSVNEMKLGPGPAFLSGYESCLTDMKIILKDEFDCEI